MRAKYGKHIRFLVGYLEDEIIWFPSQKVIRYYTNQVYHFGNISTSQVESQNA